jgi:hypothetical protein
VKFDEKKPPRVFNVGANNDIPLKDLGEIRLEPNEMVTFVTGEGRRCDFAAKDWGFYATPSVNGRLKKEGFKTALVQNELNRIFVMVVESSRLDSFMDYCRIERQTILQWLDEVPEKTK